MNTFFSVSISGIHGNLVHTEVDVTKGIGQFTIVWLTDTAIQESKERVRSAIKNSGHKFPTAARITVNLAPADLRKKWPLYDLPIALGILAKEQNFCEKIMQKSLFIGELALDGSVRGVSGILPAAVFASQNNFEYIFVPTENADEAAIVPNITTIAISNLSEAISYLNKEKNLTIHHNTNTDIPKDDIFVDFSHIIGQEQAKRAITIAAAGGHNIILQGPPWSGKTMLAKALKSILPEMELAEKIAVSEIYSVAGLLSKNQPIIHHRPFRTVHHTASEASIIGGGRDSKPGEISLAHKGILFLDEFLEFPRSILETMRQPLEDGNIVINRVQQTAQYPAQFSLVAAMNPCPCGFLWDPDKTCICSQGTIERYRAKLSWPILDRIDIFINVPRIKIGELGTIQEYQGKTSVEIRKIVQDAREMQKKRFEKTNFFCNADMNNLAIDTMASISDEARKIAISSTEKLQLSTRVYYRILRLARTIADIDWEENVEVRHILEAISYRGNT